MKAEPLPIKKGAYMFVDFTQEEQQQLQAIYDSYTPERERLKQQYIKACKGKISEEERHKLLVQQQAVMDRLQGEIDTFTEKAALKRFEPVKEGGAVSIIAHAKGQIPRLLKEVYEITERDCTGLTAELVKGMGVGTLKNKKLYLNANYAAQILRAELQMHVDALIDDKPALQELYEAIIEAIENSDYTDGTEITDLAKKPLNVRRFRRNPLADITTYGVMNDKINAQLIQDGEIFQQAADGQLTLRWAVNQAPQKKEAVPVYMALTYEGTDYKVTKKLTAFDKQVYEAVATRFYYWQQDNPQNPLYITPQEIWRTMNGKKSGGSKVSNPSKGQVQKICDSLDKMRFTRFYMDISKEITAFNLSIDDERINGGFIETYVLNSSKVEFTTDKGNVVQGYRIGEEPILYTYNKAKNHILYVPYEMLDTSQYTSDSENVAEFKGYLLQQIQLMKNAVEEKHKGKYFKRSNTILIETIYKDTGIEPPENRLTGKDFATEASKQAVIRRLRKADRDKIEGILEAWKTKGWIKGFTVLNSKNEPIREKQQAKGYSISI